MFPEHKRILLIDEVSRLQLGKFLGFQEWPRQIELDDWDNLVAGKLCTISPAMLRILVDKFGSIVLDIIRYPEMFAKEVI